jgi:hypothetical protein
MALPGAYEEQAWVGTRWMVRKRTFAHVLAIEGGKPRAYARAAGTEGPATVLTFRAGAELADGLRTAGAPYFFAEWGTRWGAQVIGMRIGKSVDWDEVAVLLTESHRLLAPRGKKAPAPR